MNVVRVLRTTAALGLIALLNGACSTVSEAVSDATPYGVQLRERVEQWDRWCKGEKLGPYNTDPRRAHITTCDFLYLKDQRWDPNADEFGRYAHSIKLPPPHDQPQVQYRPGMTSRQYFEELCAKEAGQWIFRRVTGVEGVLQVRPYIEEKAGRNQLVPQAQETVFWGIDDLTWAEMRQPSVVASYRFLEYPAVESIDGKRVVHRYYASEIDLRRLEGEVPIQWRSYRSLFQVPYVISRERRALYGYVSRGVARAEFAVHGVFANELLVIDIRTQEVLAFARNFYSVRPAPGPMSREAITLTCRNRPEAAIAPMKFIAQILMPERS